MPPIPDLYYVLHGQSGAAVITADRPAQGRAAAETRGCPDNLDPVHFRKLLGSGLTPDTIQRAGCYTERSTARLRVLLRGSPAMAPALVLPGFGPDCFPNGYDIARPTVPGQGRDGKSRKYLAPRGLESRVYFPPFSFVLSAVNTAGSTLLITEGILKALAAAQTGVACLGLMGVDVWSVRRADKTHPRVLIPDLAGIDWRGRTVLVVFDTDPVRKPGVNRAAAELARVLTDAGADVRLPRLPAGPLRDGGRPAKQAIDDYVVRRGGEGLRRWVEEVTAEPPARALEDWRREMADARAACVAPGVYADTSPTGTGKSFADAAAVARVAPKKGAAGRVSLTLLHTHDNCHEVVDEYAAQGVDAVPFPKLTSETCARYDEADAVLRRGLPHYQVLCPTCEYRDGCGYRGAFAEAVRAPHAVATHTRAAGAMSALTEGRAYITIHENPLGMLRPTFVTQRGLAAVVLVAGQAELSAREPADRLFYRYLGSVAEYLDGWHRGADKSEEVPLPEPARAVPEGMYRALNQAVLELKVSPPRDAMRITLGATLGHLSLIAVGVDERKGPGDEVFFVRTLYGVSRTDLPRDAVVWINDATASREELVTALGRPVRVMTPQGRLIPRRPVLQIVPPRDVTKGRKPESVVGYLRGLLHDLPHERVGLLTHRHLAKALPDLLGEPYRGRLVMSEYFDSGRSRGSNRWVGPCDALVVLGTPRVGADAVREHLLRLGKQRAAMLGERDRGWGPDYWSGVSVVGRRVTVRTPHYADHDWHAAYCSVVRSELVQAVGRGRGILPNGIPVYLVTTENLAPPDREDGRYGYPLADRRLAPLTDAQARVLGELHDGRGQPSWGTTAAIAARLELTERRVREVLSELHDAGRVRRAGARKVWWLPCRPS